MKTLLDDVRHGLRRMAKRPGFTAVVVTSIALGIGANTMIFSLVYGLVLRSLPYPDPDRMVMVWFTPPNRPDQRQGATFLNCEALRTRQTASFDHTGCMIGYAETNVWEEGEDRIGAEHLIGQEFTADLVQTLGVKPVIGRWFTADEEQPGHGPLMLISHQLWQRRFGGASDVIGRRMHVAFTQSAGSDLATIIGVLPERFDFFNSQTDYVFAFVLPGGAANSPSRRFLAAARLKPGVTVAQAQSEMDGFAAGLAQDQPRTNKNWKIKVQTVQEAYQGFFQQTPIPMLQGVVSFVLLIACANVAGLLLASGSSEQKELAIRAALGSGRSRLVRQLLTESLLFAVIGGALGLAIGWAGMRALVNSFPPGFPRMEEVSIDGTVLAFTAGLSLLTGLLFGIVPALQASRPDVMDTLRESTRGSTAGRSRQRLRSTFVVVQISLALVLLIGAGLTINSFLRLSSVDTGMDPRNVMSFRVRLIGDKFIRDTGRATSTGSAETEISDTLFSETTRIRERIATIPGVQSATMSSLAPPLAGGAPRLTFTIPGRPAPSTEAEALSAEWYLVSPRYFETLKVPVLRGREFNEQDTRAGLPVAVINATLAKRFWPNEDPIGRTMQLAFLNDQPRQIVGIVGDVRQNSKQQDPQPQMYAPFVQLPQFAQKQQSFGLEGVTFMVRSAGNPESLAPALRAAVAEIDRTQPASDMRTIAWYLANQQLAFRQYVLLLGIFGAVAVILAIVGIYGIMSHSVVQRTAEIGVRMALGAGGSRVLGLVLGRGMWLIAAGLAIGLGASLALTRVIKSFLWGVTPTDPETYVVVLLGLTVVALLACYIPARRAMRIDPVVALRYE